MKKFPILLFAGLTMTTSACGDFAETPISTSNSESASIAAASVTEEQRVDTNKTVGKVIANPAFENFGKLLFPVDRTITDDMTLAEISTSRVYTWYNLYSARKNS